MNIVIKAKNMTGFDGVYVPGWDCHELPIEHQVDKELGTKKLAMSQADKRRACRVYAEKYVGIQQDQFKRLGVFGDWENPYLTMAYPYEAAAIAEFEKLYLNGSVYKGRSLSTGAHHAKRLWRRPKSNTPTTELLDLRQIRRHLDIGKVLPKLIGEKVSVVISDTDTMDDSRQPGHRAER